MKFVFLLPWGAGKEGGICSSDLLLGIPAAGQAHRSSAHGCQGAGNGSRQILTLLPQWLVHMQGPYGETQRMQVRSAGFRSPFAPSVQ